MVEASTTAAHHLDVLVEIQAKMEQHYIGGLRLVLV